MKKKIRTYILLTCLMCMILTGCGTDADGEAFTEWKEGAESLEALKEYVSAVTDEDSADHIPEEDRIAVFDLDGTLYCETFPIYGEWLIFADYVLNTPEYNAPDDVKAVAEELSVIEKAEDIPSHMEEAHIMAHGKAFAGMSIDEYLEIVNEFKRTEAEGFDGMTRGEAFFLPMLEVVEYLTANDFTVYICSGTGRFTVRGLIDGVIDIPPRQVIGSDFTITADGQREENSMHYTYTDEDELLLDGDLIIKNVKMSKVAQLEQELGQKPVLVFGNSTGDVSMATYSEKDNPYRTEVFFILCDDTEREHGNPKKAENIADICKEKGWRTISMANDWETLFGKNVKRNT